MCVIVGSISEIMIFSLALGAIIAITVMMAIPTTNFHIVTAFSCSSSSSTAHTPSS
ncbi:MAG: hypothetical protein WCF23_06110 [Candidatus Nitrosopolaris sp.]